MNRIILLTSISLILVFIAAFQVQAATVVKGDNVTVIKKEKRVVRKPYRKPVIVVPKHHHHYHSFHSPLVTAFGVSIIMNKLNEPVTDKGQKVVVLGDGNEVNNVYEKDDTLYIIKG